jgi:hypothetical protein
MRQITSLVSEIIVHLIVESSNPGSLLRNEWCRARFVSDARALARSTNHTRRNAEGMAVGDLKGDGFPDIVSVSSFDKPEPVPLVRYPVSFTYGSPLDVTRCSYRSSRPIPTMKAGSPGAGRCSTIQREPSSIDMTIPSQGARGGLAHEEVA